MKKFMSHLIGSRSYYLFVIIYASFLYGMDFSSYAIPNPVPKELNTFHIPQKSFNIFNPYEAVQSGILWSETVPKDIVITPDLKGVIIAEPGLVRHMKFDTFTSESDLLVELPHVKHSPMIKVAQSTIFPLLIASAGNYKDVKIHKCVSECLLTCKSTSFQRVLKFDCPTQAIDLSEDGTLLVVCDMDHAVLYDINNGKSSRFFKCDVENWLIDVAISRDGSRVVFVENCGILKLVSIDINDGVVNVNYLKKVSTGDMITKIIYPIMGKLLYLTQDGKAKTIDMYDFLENNSHDINYLTHDGKARVIAGYEVNASDSIIGCNVKSGIFSESALYNRAVVDQGEKVATAHCASDVKSASKSYNRNIKAYRMCEDGSVEDFLLKISNLGSTYTYINDDGRRVSGIGHVVLAAIRDSRVIALGTCGKMYLWTLPEKKCASPESIKKKREKDCKTSECNDSLANRMFSNDDTYRSSHRQTISSVENVKHRSDSGDRGKKRSSKSSRSDSSGKSPQHSTIRLSPTLKKVTQNESGSTGHKFEKNNVAKILVGEKSFMDNVLADTVNDQCRLNSPRGSNNEEYDWFLKKK